jgi:tetratricopeptide (TPR) repeat protein
MGRMENPNPDETKPTPVDPQDTMPLDLSDTQPTNVKREQARADEPVQTPPALVDGQTEPVDVRPALPQPSATLPALPKPKKKRRFPAILSWSLLGLFGLILVAVLSAFGGYNSGIRLRQEAEVAQVNSTADEQFQLGLQDMQAGHFDLARQRFEYVVELNPSYPGVTEKLAEVLLYINATATPTVAPTPTITPTPDTRNVQELFTQAQQDLANSEWSKAIDTLLALRKADATYQPVWVDDMLYVSFRNRGRDKVLKDADLEGGIYDLTIAGQFGFLDADSRSLQDWARLYLTGASFWELDWAQAIYYFAQIAPALPNLRDGSGWTAAERYRLALIGYGEDLIAQEQYCDAQTQLELALSMGPDDKGQQLLDEASNQCSGGGDNGGEEDHKDKSTEPPSVETEAPTTEPVATEPPAESTPAP